MCQFLARVSLSSSPVMVYNMPYTTKYVHIKSTTVYAPRRNWDFPQLPTRRLVCSLPPVSGGRGTLAGEKGVGRVPIPTRGVHCGTLYMYVLCALYCRYCSTGDTVDFERNIIKILFCSCKKPQFFSQNILEALLLYVFVLIIVLARYVMQSVS